MICKVKNTLNRYNMLERGDKVIVALSGGSDSMVLLDALINLSDEYSLKLVAAHVNHNIRGEEALRDENFVREYCNKRDIECFILSCDVQAERVNGESVEEAGRRIRYGFFASIDSQAKIATAHNLSDCAETLIFNLTRGSGLKGLCSIPPVRDNIIRPLISVSKEEILDYCEKNNLPFVSDSTNELDCYTRNKIRHLVVPVLTEINPGFLNSVERLTQSLSEDEKLLDFLAEDLYKNAKFDSAFKVENLTTAPSPVLKRVIIKILSENCVKKPQAKHIDAVIELFKKGGATQVSDNVRFRIRNGLLEKVPDDTYDEPWSVEFKEGLISLPFCNIKIHKKGFDSTQNFKKLPLADLIDCGKIIGNVFIRSRLEGDIFTSGKTGMTKKLKKLFNEYSIPPEERNKIPIVCDDDGILWIKGFGASERAKCTDETKEVFFIEWGKLFNE